MAKEIARLVAPLVPSLPHDGETVHALEPSAGIGRFLRAFEPVPGISWHAVEWSELSARMLHVLRPDVDLTLAPFERWVREKGAGAAGRLGLVVSNPPYGIRGASIAEDPDRAYREKMAYHNFLRRGLDLLAPDGLGVFLVPGGFLTSRTAQFVALREKVLKRHHLAAAFRLPSINEKRREAIFPGAMLVTDVLFFRARGGQLDAVDSADEAIVSGGYFREFPRHILGREVGDDRGEDDQTAKPRWGYQVQGEFTGLPALVERPICGDCKVIAFPARQAADPAGGGPLFEGLRVGVPSAWNASKVDYIEFGKVTRDGQIAFRSAGEAVWKLLKSDSAQFATLKPEHYGATFPADQEPSTIRAVTQAANDRLRYSGDWPGLGWQHGPDAWVERTWPQVADTVVGALAKVSYYNQQSQKVPVVAPSGVRIVNAGAAFGTAGVDVLPPTEGGWQAFLAQAPASGLKFGELAEAGRWWWGRSIPRNLLSGEADAGDDVAEGAA